MYPSSYLLHQHLRINRMGFGAMRITGRGVWGMPEDREEALKVLQSAVALGVNFIDTADSYGPNVSEELIAEAFYPYPKDLVIATKGGFMRSGPNAWKINSGPDHLRAALEGSLKRLKQDTIQLYQLHRIDPTVQREDTFRALQRAQEEGLIQYIGLSEVSIEEIRAAGEFFEVISVQNKYSFDYRKWEPELQYCLANGIAFIPWNPMNANNTHSMASLDNMAKKYKATPHQIALAWLLQHAENIILIPGTSKRRHLEINIASASIVLDTADMEQLATLDK